MKSWDVYFPNLLQVVPTPSASLTHPTPGPTHDINTKGIDGNLKWLAGFLTDGWVPGTYSKVNWRHMSGACSLACGMRDYLTGPDSSTSDRISCVSSCNKSSWKLIPRLLKVGREFTAVDIWLLQRSRSQTREWTEGPPRVLLLSGGPASLWACLAVGPLSQRCLPVCPFCLFGRQVRVKQSWGVVGGENSTNELYTSPWQRNFSFKLTL